MALRIGMLSDGQIVMSLAIMWHTGMELHLESNLLGLQPLDHFLLCWSFSSWSST